MFEYLIFSQFIGAVLTFIVGTIIVLIIRKKTGQNIKHENPAGFWVRVICLVMDFAIINILTSFLAYRGSLTSAGQITILITLFYFFFFWLFFSATPAMMLVKIKIISQDNKPLKIWQVISRLGMFLFLTVGWITVLFDKKKKKALHDFVSRTRVVYSKNEAKGEDMLIRRLKLGMLGFTVILLIGLIIHGFGEKLTRYTENDQMTFFDINNDKMLDGLTMDADGDGTVDTYKYDLDNDHVVDFTTFDTDGDGVAESIDINNDGRVDGFDFDNDNVLDIPVSGGQSVILLWKVLFGIWAVSFVGLLGYGIFIEKNNHEKDTKK